MASLWFLMPAHKRVALARTCMRQLARTCERLRDGGIDAHAVVVADDDNLATAAELGFGTVERNNEFLGRKWNDLYQVAYREGVDYVIPIGSDDWIDPRWILAKPLPDQQTIRCMRKFACVDETGGRLAYMQLNYDGGLGIRIVPTALLHPLNGRPCVEDQGRAIDGTTLQRLRQTNRDLRLSYSDLHPLQLVDWKSPGPQLNTFEMCAPHVYGASDSPWRRVERVYGKAAVEEMRDVYAGATVG